jgi:hypothetical protein
MAVPYTVMSRAGDVFGFLTHALVLHSTFPPLGSADGAPAPATLR